jgi:hypothetical protein
MNSLWIFPVGETISSKQNNTSSPYYNERPRIKRLSSSMPAFSFRKIDPRRLFELRII